MNLQQLVIYASVKLWENQAEEVRFSNYMDKDEIEEALQMLANILIASGHTYPVDD
jgi:hypothetical protein